MILTFDLNVLVDVFARRAPFYWDALRLVNQVRKNRFAGVVPAHGVTTIYYLLCRSETRRKAELAVDFLLRHFIVGRAEARDFIAAPRSSFRDFEDAVVDQTAVESNSAFIITRDVADFSQSSVPALSPAEFIERFGPASPLLP